MKVNLKEIRQYVKENGLDERNRRRDLIDQRMYLGKYLRSRGETFTKIGQIFNLHHSTVMHSVNKFDDINGSLEFILNCTDLIIKFPISGALTEFRDTISKNNKVLVNLNSEEYLSLQTYRIDNLIYTNENAIKHMIKNCNKF